MLQNPIVKHWHLPWQAKEGTISSGSYFELERINWDMDRSQFDCKYNECQFTKLQ